MSNETQPRTDPSQMQIGVCGGTMTVIEAPLQIMALAGAIEIKCVAAAVGPMVQPGPMPWAAVRIAVQDVPKVIAMLEAAAEGARAYQLAIATSNMQVPPGSKLQ